MKHKLGISVYPDLRPMSEIVDYFELASKYGVTEVFSSMFSVEGTKEEVLAFFKSMIEQAHKFNMNVTLDVNPMCFDKMGASLQDLSVFSSIGVDTLRMDLSYGGIGDKQLIDNDFGIDIQFNATYEIARDLVSLGVDPQKINVCHNFYPQRYTGLNWESFLEINSQLKSLGGLRIAAFVSSNAEATHGVWDAVNGLPTVERLRGLPIDLQMRIMLATGNVDDFLIGNAFASEEEFESLRKIIDTQNTDTKEKHPVVVMLEESGYFTKDQQVTKVIKVDLEEGISESEQSALLDFEPHITFGDSSEWIWRSRMPRFKYSLPENTIEPRVHGGEHFQVGDVVIVNDNYKHYAGEIQIVLIPIVNDGTRNLVGRLNIDEQLMLESIIMEDIIVFQAN